MDKLGNRQGEHRITQTLTKIDTIFEELIARCRIGNDVFMDRCCRWWFMVEKVDPMAETTEEELN